MSKYEKGRTFEYRVKKELEKQGYFVIRAAASKPVDLVALKDGKAILVECKISKNPSKERLALLHVYREKSGCSVLVAVKKKRRLILKPMG